MLASLSGHGGISEISRLLLLILLLLLGLGGAQQARHEGKLLAALLLLQVLLFLDRRNLLWGIQWPGGQGGRGLDGGQGHSLVDVADLLVRVHHALLRLGDGLAQRRSGGAVIPLGRLQDLLAAPAGRTRSEHRKTKEGSAKDSRDAHGLHQVEHQGVRGEVHAVGGARDGGGDVLGSLDLSQLHEGGVLRQGLADQLRRASLTLRSHDGRFLVLQGLSNKKETDGEKEEARRQQAT